MTRVGLRWEELLMPLLQKYKLNITWGDQDLLNIIFHHNPGKRAHSCGTDSALSDDIFQLKASKLNTYFGNTIDLTSERYLYFFSCPSALRVSAGVSMQVELSP